MIPEAAVEAAARAMLAAGNYACGWESLPVFMQTNFTRDASAALEAAAPHILAAQSSAIDAVLALHREVECCDEDGESTGGTACEECKDLDDHSGERVHEVFPCLTVREVRAALAGEETFTAMRDRIESGVRK